MNNLFKIIISAVVGGFAFLGIDTPIDTENPLKSPEIASYYNETIETLEKTKESTQELYGIDITPITSIADSYIELIKDISYNNISR